MVFVMRLCILLLAAAFSLAGSVSAQDKPPESGSKMPDFLKSALGSIKPGAKPDMKDSRCQAIIGTWRGLGADRVTFSDDGKWRTGSANGTWTCSDPGSRKFAINLPSGRVIMALEPKATRASARDDQGHLFVAHKEDVPKPPPKPPVASPAGPCVAAVGHWLWPDGVKVALSASGLVASDRQGNGHWRCVEPALLKIGVQFGATPEIALTLSGDHGRLEGATADGWPIVAERH
jgi:hypothetical protein